MGFTQMKERDDDWLEEHCAAPCLRWASYFFNDALEKARRISFFGSRINSMWLGLNDRCYLRVT